MAKKSVPRTKSRIKPRAKIHVRKKRPASRTKRKVATVKTAPPRVLHVITETSALQARMMAARGQGLTVGFVPTMGALHDGHAALLDEARRRADIVVCSIFVNPKQFGANEDLAKYPRDLESDRRLCNACGVDIIYAPNATDIYPLGFDTVVKAGALANQLEGASRPGHFDGVLTVCSLLFHIVQPHFAVFGEKDYQQLTLIRRMVRDLKIAIEIVALPVIRAIDGVALSSRNAYLKDDERARATCLYHALVAAQDEAQRGTKDAAKIVAAARAPLEATAGFTIDYVTLADPRTLTPVRELDRDARLLIAGKLGAVRLIDNGPIFHAVRYDA